MISAIALDLGTTSIKAGLLDQNGAVHHIVARHALTPLISWQDNRGAGSCAALRPHEQSIRNLTGLPLTPYYFAPKLRVVLQENPSWRARLERGELLAGTLDTFLIWRWSGGKYFVTDASMAARTLLMDLRP